MHLKVCFGDFHTITRAQMLARQTNVTQEISQAAAQMFAERLPARRLQIRLLGVGMSGFDRPAMVQLSLFSEGEHEGRLGQMKWRTESRSSSASQDAPGLGCCTMWIPVAAAWS